MPDKFGAVCYVPGDSKINNSSIVAEFSKERFALEKALGMIEACFNSADLQIKFESNADLVGVNGTAQKVRIIIANGMGVQNPFSKIEDVTVTLVSGAANLSAQPVKFVRKEVNSFQLEYVAEITVTPTAAAQTVKLGLTDSAGSDLDVSDVLDIVIP